MIPASPTPILVADRDDHSRNRLATALQEGGYEPLPARNGKEAVEVARSRVVTISILDVLLPDLTGLETFELLATVRGRVQGIFLAEETNKETLVRLLDAGAFTVLGKPPRLDWLLDAVNRLMQRLGREDKA